MIIPDYVPVDSDGDSRVGVSQLRLRNWHRRAALEKQTGVGVAKSVEATTRDLQRVENRCESLPYHILGDEKMPAAVHEKPAH